MSKQKDLITVAYIMSYAHSGSTVLDMLLGAHPQIASCGELDRFHEPQWLSTEQCACGQVVADCSFWSGVFAEWRKEFQEDEVSRLTSAAKQLERYRTLLKSRAAMKTMPDFSLYARGMETMYRAISRVSGKSIIVDSSKSPFRALLLANVDGIDLRLIHLVRDGRAVAWSMVKSRARKSGARAERKSWKNFLVGLDWLVVNVAAGSVRSRLDLPSCRVLYEEYAPDPRSALVRIEQSLRLPVSPSLGSVAGQIPIPSSHVLAGNQVRSRGVEKLKIDQEWVKALGRSEQRIIWGVIWPLARKYGYRWNGNAGASTGGHAV